MTDEEKLALCGNTLGLFCDDHFYNGHNDLGIKKCWSLENARLVKRNIYPSLDSREPVVMETLHCFRPQYNLKRKWVKKAGLGGEKSETD